MHNVKLQRNKIHHANPKRQANVINETTLKLSMQRLVLNLKL